MRKLPSCVPFRTCLTPIAAGMLGVCSSLVWAEQHDAPSPAPAVKIELEADRVSGSMDEKIRAEGQVVLKRADQCVRSDWLEYFPKTQRVKAGDEVTLERGTDVVRGKNLEYQLAPTPNGSLDQVTITSSHTALNTPLQVTGSFAEIKGEGRYALKDGRVTLCPPGREDWYVRADQLDVDIANNHGVARGGRFEFLGMPLLYVPYLSFPVTGQRKSGLLAPTFAQRSLSGFDIALPYYFNIAPNMDATLTSRVVTRRGAMLGGEFRYLQPNFSGSFHGEWMPEDRQLNRSRHGYSFRHDHQLSSNLTFQAQAHHVSDDDYFRHFGNRASYADNVHLPREAVLTWQPNFGVGQIRVQRYQTLQDTNSRIETPYARLPQMTFFTGKTLPMGLRAEFFGEFAQFAHPTRQEGRRLSTVASLSLPIETQYGFLKPKMTLNWRQYALKQWGNLDARNERVSVPTFSIDSGLIFDRPTQYFGRNAIQTLEPRLFYVRTPFRDQQSLPLFDTSENSFDFSQIFSENRFSGRDRVSDANTLTAALTSRFIDREDGEERLRVSIAQRYSFGEQRVTLSGLPDERKKSDFLASVGGKVWRDVWLNGVYQWNPQLAQTRRYAVDIRYHPAVGKTLSARYRYGRDELFLEHNERDTLRQIDVALQWPIRKNWYVVARENYSLSHKKPLEHLLGIEYHRDCWALRLVGQHYASSTRDTSTNIFVQLELNGLGGVGSNPMETLRLAIPGYSKINDIQR